MMARPDAVVKLRTPPGCADAPVEHGSHGSKDETPERVYFHDSDGRTWRVYDRAYGLPHAEPNRHHTFPKIGDPRATLRWFQARDGSARLYRLGATKDGLADVATLADQFERTWTRALPVGTGEPVSLADAADAMRPSGLSRARGRRTSDISPAVAPRV